MCEAHLVVVGSDYWYVWQPMWLIYFSATVALFVAAGLLEVAGGWLVWGALRGGRPGWFAALGAVLLVGYGFVPCAQPLDDFGRIYAVYGGFFIVLSLAWGALLDGFRPDVGDYVGAAVALVGVLIMMIWRRPA